MYTWIKRSFIPGYENTADSAVRLRYGLVAGILGIASNLLLFSLKLLIGFMTGSISVVADAVNNLSDAGSSIVTFIGFRLSSRPPDLEHPFGHARYEYLAGLVIALAVFAVGVILAKSSIEKIIVPAPIDSSPAAIVLLTAAIFTKLWQGGLYKNFAVSIDSPALKASAVDSRNDVLATAAVLVSLIAAAAEPNLKLDGAVGLLVSAFIVFSSLKLLKETSNPLIGTAPSPETIDAISTKVLSYEGIIGVHDLIVHNYGPASKFATIHAEVPAEQDLLKCHDIIDAIERDVFRELGIYLVIHMDPVVAGDSEAEALKARALAALRAAAGSNVTIHDFRMIRNKNQTKLLFDAVIPFESKWNRTSLETLLEKSFNEGAEGAKKSYVFVLNIDHPSGQ